MPRLLLLTALSLSAGALPAYAEDWRVVSMGPGQGGALLVDIDSVTRKPGDVQTAKVLAVYSETGDTKADRTAAVIVDTSFDCKLNRSRSDRLTSYDSEGRITLQRPLGDGWEDIRQGTKMEAAVGIACSRAVADEHQFGAGIPIKPIREILRINGF